MSHVQSVCKKLPEGSGLNGLNANIYQQMEI